MIGMPLMQIDVPVHGQKQLVIVIILFNARPSQFPIIKSKNLFS